LKYFVFVRISQQVYFALFSTEMLAAEMTAHLGIEPDDFTVRGSRNASMPMPRYHIWKLGCRCPGLSIEQQIEKTIERLLPCQSKIAVLAEQLSLEGSGSGASLNVVRYFDDENGEEEADVTARLADGQEFVKLSGQHQLLGWILSVEVMQFLIVVGANLNVDEYE